MSKGPDRSRDAEQPIPIPRTFFDECDGRPFVRCSACSGSLLDEGLYSIHKGYFGERCVLEFVACEKCEAELAQCCSEYSRRKIDEFFERATRVSTEPGDAEVGCLFCVTERTELVRYTLVARCRQLHLLGTFCACERCEDALHEQLSAETRGEMDRFRNLCLPGVPEVGLDVPAAS